MTADQLEAAFLFLPTIACATSCIALMFMRNNPPAWLRKYTMALRERRLPRAVDKTILFCITWVLIFTLTLGLRKSGLPVPSLLAHYVRDEPPVVAVIFAIVTLIWSFVEEEIRRPRPVIEDWLLWDLSKKENSAAHSAGDRAGTPFQG